MQTTFSFDAGSSRLRQFKERIASGGSRQLEETLYLGDYEREEHTTKASNTASPVLTKTVHRHTLGDIGVYTRAVNASTGTTVKLTTVLKDHLGSTACLYIGTWNGTAFVNQIVEGQSFDPWGERRDANTWTNFRTASGDSHRTSAQDYDRGYTGHEQLDESGLIHMNGRIYDPEIGRFLSPDPYVQVPEYSQNFNRYSYVLNNPLNGVDPSGFLLITKMFHKKMAWLKENWRTVVVIVVAVVLTIFTAGIGTAAALAAAGTTAAAAAAAGTLAAFAGSMLALAVNGAFIGFVTGGLSAALAGGDLGDVLRGAVVGGISGALTAGMHAVGGTAMMNAANIVGHGIIGGLSNVAMGGKFGDGFLSAAASAATSVSGLTNPETSSLNIVGRTAVAAAAGGTASVIGGGKFGNGAVTGAMHHLLNAEAGSNLYRRVNAGNNQELTVVDESELIPRTDFVGRSSDLSDTNQKYYGECVSLPKALGNLGATSGWSPGESVFNKDPAQGPIKSQLEKGTVIATFTDKNKFYGHAAIFHSFENINGQKGIMMYDQWKTGSPKLPGLRFVPYKNSGYVSNDAAQFKTVLTKK